MRAAIVSSGRVVNVVELGKLSELPGAVACPSNNVGDLFDGVAFSTPPVAPRFATVPAALAGRKADCDALAVAKRATITQGISPAEMASWPIKRAEALAYQASGNAADAPMLQVEATARGVTLAVLAGKVLDKAALLSQFEAQIAGNNGRHNDALDALAAAQGTTVAQLEAYDITTGWPV